MELHHDPRLTSAEIAYLWNTYKDDSATICLIYHFFQRVDDQDIKACLEHTIQLAESHMERVAQLFAKENIPVPRAFPADQHVNLNAARLYTDMFYCDVMLNATRFAVLSHTMGLNISSREDVFILYSEFYEEANHVLKEILDTMKGKGIFVRPPYIPYPDKLDIVEKHSFVKGWMGKRRSLLAIEAAQLFDNGITNQMGKELLTGFIQTVRDPQIKEYFIRGRELASEFVSKVQSLLEEDLVPNGMTWDSKVTKSTDAPYSDQLMLFLVSTLNALGVARYGQALSMTLRRDVASYYMRCFADTTAYSEDGLDLLIQNKWFEQPPPCPERDELAGK
ncbi:hypothetical protein B9K06_20955 [Bacillus sp. OG2]|nr:hypothetical protein B9K06_20955 [Bacillus sp. OG2]